MIKYSANKLIKKLDLLYLDQKCYDDSYEHFKEVKNKTIENYQRYQDSVPKRCSKLPFREGYFNYCTMGIPYTIIGRERQIKMSRCSVGDGIIFGKSAIELVKTLQYEDTPESKKTLKQVMKGFNKYYKRVTLVCDPLHIKGYHWHIVGPHDFSAYFCSMGARHYRSRYQFNADKYDESVQVAFEQKVLDLFKEKATQLMEKEPLSQPENPRLNSKNKNKEFVDRYHIWLELRKVETERIQSDNDREKTAKKKAQKKTKSNTRT